MTIRRGRCDRGGRRVRDTTFGFAAVGLVGSVVLAVGVGVANAGSGGDDSAGSMGTSTISSMSTSTISSSSTSSSIAPAT